MPDLHEATVLLGGLQGREAVELLYPIVYGNLHRLAERQLRGERSNHTLNATALVHEAYLRLAAQERASFQNRSHFLSVAAVAMRRILVSYARRKHAERRGGGAAMVTFEEGMTPRHARATELVDLDEALTRLEGLSARQAQIVTFRFFAGLTYEEIADLLGDTPHSVRYDWRVARAWLKRELAREEPS